MSLTRAIHTALVRLLDAYKAQESVKDKELLLSALKCGKNQRYLIFAFFPLNYDRVLDCLVEIGVDIKEFLNLFQNSFGFRSIDEVMYDQSLEYELAVTIRV